MVAGGAAVGGRDQAIDVFKGQLVVTMVVGHVLQFFTDTQRLPTAAVLVEFANVVAFPGFVFAFGFVVHLAYLDRWRPGTVRRMLRTSARILMAFYASGIAFRVFVSRQAPDLETVLPVVGLFDIPGWSEFLVSFALFVLVAALLRPALAWLLEHRLAFWLVFFGLLATTFIPYDRVQVTQLGLLIGSTQFASFPVVQYLPFFLAGMYFHRFGVRFAPLLFIGALVATSVAIIQAASSGALPGRFPPTLAWILLPMGLLYTLLLLARALPERALPVRWLGTVGTNVLTYLLLSNLVIFALSGTHAGLRLELASALAFAAALLAFIAFVIRLSRRTPGSSPRGPGSNAYRAEPSPKGVADVSSGAGPGGI